MKKAILGLLVALSFIPSVASAHEVYVLTHDEVVNAIHLDSPNPFTAIPTQEKLFLTYAIAIAFAVIVVLFFSISPLFERVFDLFLMKLKKFAPLIGRLTLGASLIASGYYVATFGPELPISALVSGSYVHIMSLTLLLGGIFISLGLLTRLVAIVGAAIFAALIFQNGWYMLTYLGYLGEFILFIILGGGAWSLDSLIPFFRRIDGSLSKIKNVLERYSFFFMRILFGFSVLFSSSYSKFFHSNLALDTIADYHLTNYFHFTPLFLVLGAFLVEAVIGIFIMSGFELRFTAIVFTCFLTMSILFFGEAVWPHIILFGATLSIFCHGYDSLTTEKAFFQRKRDGEPVL